MEKIRKYTRADEFDYVDWTIDAVVTKLSYATLGLGDYLDREQQRQVVLDYIRLVGQIQTAEYQLNMIYADPNISNPEETAQPVRAQLDELFQEREELQPLAEIIIQQMISQVIKDMDLDFLGQPIPQVMFHTTPLPWALIVSPREVIQQDANISLAVELTVEDHIHIEDQISANLDVSTLVVPIGGVGTYPSMIAQTTNLNWLMEVSAHEWIHNFLTLNPLGVRYDKSPELRTINETTASIAGDEIGAAVIAKYFPELVPIPPQPPPKKPFQPQTAAVEPVFDFRAEMFETRVTADQLLAEGKLDEAEAYMESRREFFWAHGYQIRKLNQAYFAFYGAYADTPGGSAGEDPVGAAVRALRTQAATLGEFINLISKVKSFEELLKIVKITS